MEISLTQPTVYADDAVRKQKELDRRTILKSYYTLYKLGNCPSAKDNAEFMKLMRKAFRFVLQTYQQPNYAFISPDVFYPIEIAIITAEKFRLGAKSIVCALLHNILKDKKITELTLRKEFGNEVASIIVGFTKKARSLGIDSNNITSNLSYLVSYFSEDNLLIVLIKFAEYLHNMYIIDKFPREKQLQLAGDSSSMYISLAHNLGLDNVYLELKDLHLRFGHRAVYDSIVKKLRATKATRRGFLERFVEPIKNGLNNENIQFSMKGRTKSIASISHKIKYRNVPFDSIYDFYAIRIIFESSIEDEYSSCWSIYELITSIYEPKITNLRDWLSYPKDSGYEALHITVMSPEGQWVEIQIRAKRMDDNAEYGEAAHWKYKRNNLGKEFENMAPKWIEKARDYLENNGNFNKKNNISLSVSNVYVTDYMSLDE